ncbi:MAG: metal-sulfur cluster assembly factor [Alphaproteobacteria bacterium]
MIDIKNSIIEELKKIYDPEIPVNIWDMGLIYGIDVQDKIVNIKMTFTSPTCPMMEELLEQVKNSVQQVVQDKNVNVELVWEPAWNLSKMSDAAKLELDLTNQGW